MVKLAKASDLESEDRECSRFESGWGYYPRVLLPSGHTRGEVTGRGVLGCIPVLDTGGGGFDSHRSDVNNWVWCMGGMALSGRGGFSSTLDTQTKACAGCHQTLSIDQFHRQGRGYRATCKACRSAKETSPESKEKRSQSTNARREQLRQWLWDYLSDKFCADCGENDPIVLEFDHLRDKEASVSKLIQWGAKIETIEAEIAKCEIRCANCHRRVTYQRANSWRTRNVV